MRYPIRRSNSRLSFAFQEPTRLCVPNTPDSFRYKEYLCPGVLRRFLRYM